MASKFDPSFVADFGDGEYPFRLVGIDTWAECEEKCDAPLFAIFAALRITALWLASRMQGPPPAPDAFPAHSFIVEPIRLALIGGGMKAVEALALVRSYVVNGKDGLSEHVPLALRCVQAAIFGPEELTSKKAPAESASSEPATAA